MTIRLKQALARWLWPAMVARFASSLSCVHGAGRGLKGSGPVVVVLRTLLTYDFDYVQNPDLAGLTVSPARTLREARTCTLAAAGTAQLCLRETVSPYLAAHRRVLTGRFGVTDGRIGAQRGRAAIHGDEPFHNPPRFC